MTNNTGEKQPITSYTLVISEQMLRMVRCGSFLGHHMKAVPPSVPVETESFVVSCGSDSQRDVVFLSELMSYGIKYFL